MVSNEENEMKGCYHYREHNTNTCRSSGDKGRAKTHSITSPKSDPGYGSVFIVFGKQLLHYLLIAEITTLFDV